MRIAKVGIKSYKSFLDLDDVSLEPGFNVIVGKNNAGKTALVEALALLRCDSARWSPVVVKQVISLIHMCRREPRLGQ